MPIQARDGAKRFRAGSEFINVPVAGRAGFAMIAATDDGISRPRRKEHTAMTAPAWKEDLASREQEHLDELVALLKMPSVSTDPGRAGDVAATAEWVAERLRKAGVPEVLVAQTKGHPAVLGSWHVGDDKPTILIYGHYDV